ncbi:MAG: WG repeat-containing protein [Anaerovoracaceae bacterium]
MFCKNCGNKLGDDDIFCKECGTKVRMTPDEQAEQESGNQADKVEESENQATEAPDAEIQTAEATGTEIQTDSAEETENQATEMEQEEVAQSSDSPQNKKIPKPVIIALAVLIAVAGIAAAAMALLNTQKVEALPREYAEADAYLNKQLELIEKAAADDDYLKLAELINSTEGTINAALLCEGTEEEYAEEIIELAWNAEEKIIDYKLADAKPVLTALNEESDFEAMADFYTSDMLALEDKEEIVDLAFYALADQEEFERAENALKGLIVPFTEENFQKVRKYQSYLEEKYPDRERSWDILDMKKYDKLMKFKNGLAKVGMKKGGSGVNTVYSWGMINAEGDEILKPEYDMIGEFSEGLVAVQKNGKWGFVDETGDVVIDFEYDDLKDTQDAVFYAYAKRDPEMVARGFYGGFAAVTKNGKSGFIDKEGKPLGEGIIYQDVWYFSEGIATVELDGKYGLIDTTGRYIVEPNTESISGINYDVVRTVYEGLAGVNWNDRKERGVIDKTGELVIAFDPERIDLVQDYREGLANVRYNGKWGFIDRMGQIVIPIQYDSVSVFIDGVAKVCNNEKYGLINRNGQTLLPIQYDGIGSFVNDFAIVKKDEKYGFVNKQGQFICDLKYENVRNFENGFACVKENGKWGIIDETGEMVISPIYDDMKSYSDGVAPAMLGELWGYVDINGYFVVSPEFEKADQFSEGYAAVQKDGEKFYIRLKEVPVNVTGQIVDEYGEGIANATINVYDTADKGLVEAVYIGSCDNDGKFNLLLSEGEYKLIVMKDGYMESCSYQTVEGLETNYAASIVMIGESGDDGSEAEISVRIGDALNGQGISNAEIRFREGFNNKNGKYVKNADGEVLCVSTSNSGNFYAVLPYGLYTAEVEFGGYTTTWINVVSSDISQGKEIRTSAMTEVLADGETRITLEWGENPSDLDSHLFGPTSSESDSGTFHIYYPVKEQRIGDAMLDKDDVEGNGFETTTIYRQHDGTYKYCVFDFTNGSSYESDEMSFSNARVSVYQKDRCVAVFDVPVNKVGNLWEVFELNGNTITPINNVTNHMDISEYVYNYY